MLRLLVLAHLVFTAYSQSDNDGLNFVRRPGAIGPFPAPSSPNTITQRQSFQTDNALNSLNMGPGMQVEGQVLSSQGTFSGGAQSAIIQTQVPPEQNGMTPRVFSSESNEIFAPTQLSSSISSDGSFQQGGEISSSRQFSSFGGDISFNQQPEGILGPPNGSPILAFGPQSPNQVVPLQAGPIIPNQFGSQFSSFGGDVSFNQQPAGVLGPPNESPILAFGPRSQNQVVPLQAGPIIPNQGSSPSVSTSVLNQQFVSPEGQSVPIPPSFGSQQPPNPEGPSVNEQNERVRVESGSSPATGPIPIEIRNAPDLLAPGMVGGDDAQVNRAPVSAPTDLRATNGLVPPPTAGESRIEASIISRASSNQQTRMHTVDQPPFNIQSGGQHEVPPLDKQSVPTPQHGTENIVMSHGERSANVPLPTLRDDSQLSRQSINVQSPIHDLSRFGSSVSSRTFLFNQQHGEAPLFPTGNTRDHSDINLPSAQTVTVNDHSGPDLHRTHGIGPLPEHIRNRPGFHMPQTDLQNEFPLRETSVHSATNLQAINNIVKPPTDAEQKIRPPVFQEERQHSIAMGEPILHIPPGNHPDVPKFTQKPVQIVQVKDQNGGGIKGPGSSVHVDNINKIPLKVQSSRGDKGLHSSVPVPLTHLNTEKNSPRAQQPPPPLFPLNLPPGNAPLPLPPAHQERIPIDSFDVPSGNSPIILDNKNKVPLKDLSSGGDKQLHSEVPIPITHVNTEKKSHRAQPMPPPLFPLNLPPDNVPLPPAPKDGISIGSFDVPSGNPPIILEPSPQLIKSFPIDQAKNDKNVPIQHNSVHSLNPFPVDIAPQRTKGPLQQAIELIPMTQPQIPSEPNKRVATKLETVSKNQLTKGGFVEVIPLEAGFLPGHLNTPFHFHPVNAKEQVLFNDQNEFGKMPNLKPLTKFETFPHASLKKSVHGQSTEHAHPPMIVKPNVDIPIIPVVPHFDNKHSNIPFPPSGKMPNLKPPTKFETFPHASLEKPVRLPYTEHAHPPMILKPNADIPVIPVVPHFNSKHSNVPFPPIGKMPNLKPPTKFETFPHALLEKSVHVQSAKHSHPPMILKANVDIPIIPVVPHFNNEHSNIPFPPRLKNNFPVNNIPPAIHMEKSPPKVRKIDDLLLSIIHNKSPILNLHSLRENIVTAFPKSYKFQDYESFNLKHLNLLKSPSEMADFHDMLFLVDNCLDINLALDVIFKLYVKSTNDNVMKLYKKYKPIMIKQMDIYRNLRPNSFKREESIDAFCMLWKNIKDSIPVYKKLKVKPVTAKPVIVKKPQKHIIGKSKISKKHKIAKIIPTPGRKIRTYNYRYGGSSESSSESDEEGEYGKRKLRRSNENSGERRHRNILNKLKLILNRKPKNTERLQYSIDEDFGRDDDGWFSNLNDDRFDRRDNDYRDDKNNGDQDFNDNSFGRDRDFNDNSFGRDDDFNDRSFGRDDDFSDISFGLDDDFDGRSLRRVNNTNNILFRRDDDFGDRSFGGDDDFNDMFFGLDDDFDGRSLRRVNNTNSILFRRDDDFGDRSFGGDDDFNDTSFGLDDDFDGRSFRRVNNTNSIFFRPDDDFSDDHSFRRDDNGGDENRFRDDHFIGSLDSDSNLSLLGRHSSALSGRYSSEEHDD